MIWRTKNPELTTQANSCQIRKCNWPEAHQIITCNQKRKKDTYRMWKFRMQTKGVLWRGEIMRPDHSTTCLQHSFVMKWYLKPSETLGFRASIATRHLFWKRSGGLQFWGAKELWFGKARTLSLLSGIYLEWHVLKPVVSWSAAPAGLQVFTATNSASNQ